MHKEKSKEEINRILNILFDGDKRQRINKRFRANKYAEGIKIALEWVVGEIDDEEMEETFDETKW